MSVQGLTPQSFYNMQLNAGAFFENIDVSGAKSASDVAVILKQAVLDGKCLGATSGGGSFVAQPQARQIEADGMRYQIIGSTIFDSWDVKITTTLKEITGENMTRALATGEINPVTGAIRFRTNLQPTDYIESLTWVGDKLDGGLIAIAIDNAVNITGANFVFTDKGEGTLPVEFTAHQADLENMEYAPCAIYMFDATVPIPVTGVSLNHSTLSINTGDIEPLVATIAPTNATNIAVTWASDDNTVVSVDNKGSVTGISIGNANIIATSADNPAAIATCAITVA